MLGVIMVMAMGIFLVDRIGVVFQDGVVSSVDQKFVKVYPTSNISKNDNSFQAISSVTVKVIVIVDIKYTLFIYTMCLLYLWLTNS